MNSPLSNSSPRPQGSKGYRLRMRRKGSCSTSERGLQQRQHRIPSRKQVKKRVLREQGIWIKKHVFLGQSIWLRLLVLSPKRVVCIDLISMEWSEKKLDENHRCQWEGKFRCVKRVVFLWLQWNQKSCDMIVYAEYWCFPSGKPCCNLDRCTRPFWDGSGNDLKRFRQ